MSHMIAKSVRCRIVIYVASSLGSFPAKARMKLQKLGFSCAAARVGGVGGASWTRKMQGAATLSMIARTRIWWK